MRDLKLFPPTRFLAYDISIGPQRFVVVIRIRHIPLKDLNNGNYKRERDRKIEMKDKMKKIGRKSSSTTKSSSIVKSIFKFDMNSLSHVVGRGGLDDLSFLIMFKKIVYIIIKSILHVMMMEGQGGASRESEGRWNYSC